MSTNQTAPNAPGGKQHFEVLDGLRGVAALGVVIFHFMEWVLSDYTKNFIGHGFLAVDFFFCLSGFVIGYAYDDRIGNAGVFAFFKARLIRLHPLVVLGSALGLIGFFLDPFAPDTAYGAGKIILLFLASILMVPLPIMQERGFNNFGLNAPAWSLFWEYIINLLYAFILCRAGRRVLIVLTVLAAAGICFVSYRAGNLMGGWSKENFWDGGARVAYSFLAGLLVYRSKWIIKNRLGFAGLTVLLSVALVMPWFSFNWIVEAVIVLFYFPLIVSLGAGTTVSSGLRKTCVFSGNISYPLYMTHYWAIWIFGNYFISQKPGMEQLAYIIIAGTIFLVGFAWLVMKLYDVPVRKYLNRKFYNRLTRKTTDTGSRQPGS